MSRHEFGATVHARCGAHQHCVESFPGRHAPGRAHAGLVRPRSPGALPAVISPDENLPLGSRARALVTIVLAGNKPEAFFAHGQHFPIWVGGVVGHALRAGSLLGHGVIVRRVPLPPGRAERGGTRRRAGGAASRPLWPRSARRRRVIGAWRSNVASQCAGWRRACRLPPVMRACAVFNGASGGPSAGARKARRRRTGSARTRGARPGRA